MQNANAGVNIGAKCQMVNGLAAWAKPLSTRSVAAEMISGGTVSCVCDNSVGSGDSCRELVPTPECRCGYGYGIWVVVVVTE